MEDEEALLACSGAAVVIAYIFQKQQRRPRRWWRREVYKKRAGNDLMRALKCQEISGQYKNFTRMSPTNFEDLLMKIGPKIGKRPTNMREPISIQDRSVFTH